MKRNHLMNDVNKFLDEYPEIKNVYNDEVNIMGIRWDEMLKNHKREKESVREKINDYLKDNPIKPLTAKSVDVMSICLEISRLTNTIHKYPYSDLESAIWGINKLNELKDRLNNITI